LATVGGHKQHFPEATLDRFLVLLVTTHHGRRKALGRALKEKGCRTDLWRIAVQEDLAAENFPFGEVFFDCEGQARPLLRKSSDSSES